MLVSMIPVGNGVCALVVGDFMVGAGGQLVRRTISIVTAMSTPSLVGAIVFDIRIFHDIYFFFLGVDLELIKKMLN